MADKWKDLSAISHTDSSGDQWNRRVVYDKDTGKVERSFGTDYNMSHERSSRHVGYASNEEEAIEMAQRDLDSTF